MPEWKTFEGESANGEFPLERYLGGETKAVFLTRFGTERAAIRLAPAGGLEAGKLVERWKRAAALQHRNLAAIHAAGIWLRDGEPLAYAVTEYAEENLADVLRERPLSTDETREMLLPVAEALAYLHGRGLVHGELKPSHIFAVGETVKVSAESVSTGDPAADIEALGVTLVQALQPRTATATAVPMLPAPFREMAENCLRPERGLRWPAERIAAWLKSPGRPAVAAAAVAAAPEESKGKSRYYALVAGMVVVGAIVGAMVTRSALKPAVVASEPVARPPVPAPVAREPVAPAPTAPVKAPSAPAARETRADRKAEPPGERAGAADGVVRRVLPDIPEKARNTITGKPVVAVRVSVDAAGKVRQATLERTVSPYFGKLALEAARKWQFVPAEGTGARSWLLRFELTRTNTGVVVKRE